MTSQKRERLENKLKLWETPGFLEFVEDLQNLPDNPVDMKQAVLILQAGYKLDMMELDRKGRKFKQGELGL